MKHLLILSFICLFMTGVIGQEKRASPLIHKSKIVKNVQVTIQYSQTSMRERTIFGDLVPFDQVWRTGANEATVLQFNKSVNLNGKPLKAGKYSLFTVPGEKKWTVIINKIWSQWGSYNYDETKDVLRFEVESIYSEKHEKLNIDVNSEGLFRLMWEETAIEFILDKF
jgi:hypothetical protein